MSNTTGAKILVGGLSNAGKTTLLTKLNQDTSGVISYDGKPFPLKMWNVTVTEYEFTNISDIIDATNYLCEQVLEKTGKKIETIAFDSMSRIFTKIEANCTEQYNGFDVWKNVNIQIELFNTFINDILRSGINVILISHVFYDESSKKYMEVTKGSFGKTGGYLSTVDYSVYIELKGNERIVHHKNHNMARTLIDKLPEKQKANDFNLQEYIDIVKEINNQVQEWSL